MSMNAIAFNRFGLDTLIASAVSQHYRLDPARTGRALFPNIGNARPLEGLIRA